MQGNRGSGAILKHQETVVIYAGADAGPADDADARAC